MLLNNNFCCCYASFLLLIRLFWETLANLIRLRERRGKCSKWNSLPLMPPRKTSLTLSHLLYLSSLFSLSLSYFIYINLVLPKNRKDGLHLVRKSIVRKWKIGYSSFISCILTSEVKRHLIHCSAYYRKKWNMRYHIRLIGL